MIRQYPPLQYLVPIYTFESSLAILASQLDSKAGAVGIQRASLLVDKFLDGGFLSNKNVFRGMCVVYIQEINYDDPDRDRIYSDRLDRLNNCDSTIAAFVSMQIPLAKLAAHGADSASEEVRGYLEDARAGMRNFFSKVPPNDIKRVKEWIGTINAADADRNGKLEGSELDALSQSDKSLYQAVGDFLG